MGNSLIPTPTLLSFNLSPSRGFHSTLSATIALNYAAPECSAFVLYTLPPNIIIDRYELSDRDISFELWGESNLELPAFAVNQSEGTLLLNATSAARHSQEIVVDVPVHARYGLPLSGEVHYQSIEIPAPTCFWACPGSGMLNESSRMLNYPDAVSVDVSICSTSSPSLPAAKLEIPLGSVHDLPLVEAGTVTVVLLTFLWLLYRSCTCADKLRTQHMKQC